MADKRQTIEEAKQALDCALNDDTLRVIIVSLRHEDNYMSVQVVNGNMMQAAEILQIAMMHTANAASPEEIRRAN